MIASLRAMWVFCASQAFKVVLSYIVIYHISYNKKRTVSPQCPHPPNRPWKCNLIFRFYYYIKLLNFFFVLINLLRLQLAVITRFVITCLYTIFKRDCRRWRRIIFPRRSHHKDGKRRCASARATSARNGWTLVCQDHIFRTDGSTPGPGGTDNNGESRPGGL